MSFYLISKQINRLICKTTPYLKTFSYIQNNNLNHHLYSTQNVHKTVTSINLKKRPVRKKKTLEELSSTNKFNVLAFATAEKYDLDKLAEGLKEQDLYEQQIIPNTDQVIRVIAKYKIENEPRELFFFRDGGVILWNVTDLESENVLTFLKKYEEDAYSENLIQEESEIMKYTYHNDIKKLSCLDGNGDFVLSKINNSEIENLSLVKYTFSNAMLQSVKLGIWEASLDQYINEIEEYTEMLKSGQKIKISREEILKKHGELFALRHYLNLTSDILDTPDFYWENEKLEKLYNQVCVYFCINKRTKVMNEKINHCVALVELISAHLSDKHHIRLEWMIIVLIMVEVCFETIHAIERFL